MCLTRYKIALLVLLIFVSSVSLHAEIKIYNIRGQLVRKLENITKIDSCNYSIQWDGKNNQGREVANSVYFYTLQLDDNTVSKKMLLVR